MGDAGKGGGEGGGGGLLEEAATAGGVRLFAGHRSVGRGRGYGMRVHVIRLANMLQSRISKSRYGAPGWVAGDKFRSAGRVAPSTLSWPFDWRSCGSYGSWCVRVMRSR